MDRKSAAVVMSWRTTGEIIKDSAVARELGCLRPGGHDHRLPGRKRFAVEVDNEECEPGEGVDPWRGRCLPAGQAGPEDARVLLRGPDQEHDDREGAEEMPDGRTVGREQDVDEDRRPREQGDGCDVAASPGERLN